MSACAVLQAREPSMVPRLSGSWQTLDPPLPAVRQRLDMQAAEHSQLITGLEDDLQSAVLRQGADATQASPGGPPQQPGNSMLGIVTNQRDRFRRRCVLAAVCDLQW